MVPLHFNNQKHLQLIFFFSEILHICIFLLNKFKILGCFNPTLGQIWTNPAVELNVYIQFLTQKVGLVHIWPKVGLKQPSIFLECGK